MLPPRYRKHSDASLPPYVPSPENEKNKKINKQLLLQENLSVFFKPAAAEAVPPPPILLGAPRVTPAIALTIDTHTWKISTSANPSREALFYLYM